MTKLVNLTPHPLILVGEGGERVSIRPSGRVARVETLTTLVEILEVEGVRVPLLETSYGEVEGLPNPAEDTLYVVSSIVRAACPHRRDLVSPTRLVRDEAGRIVGARALTR